MQLIAVEIIGIANMLRRKTFEHMDDEKIKDGPTSAQHWFLSYLWEHRQEEVLQKDFEKAFKIRRSTTAEILKVMERKGLINKVDSEIDRRSKIISLTPKAIEICKDHQMRMLKTEELLTKGLSTEEIASLRVLLSKIQDNIDADCIKS